MPRPPKPTVPDASSSLPPLWLAFIFVLIFSSFCLLPRIYESTPVLESFIGTAGVLCVILVFLIRQVARTGRVLSFEYVPKKVHYVQLTMHSCIFAYWGWYWREVYHDIPLILAQVAFVYALDSMVCWFRRDKWVLGFGPFPIVFSTNLFLWFHDHWFYLQFVMVGVGVLAKEFLKWKREGRLVHIFNPSALSLATFSAILIATNNTSLTWGIEISNTISRPPHIYMELFLLGLIVQSLFQVTLVTFWAAVALFGLNLAYTHFTGVYHFVDSGIPVSVFLGLHLLVTDPATSPRSNLGKAIFGALYGIGVFASYGALGWFGAPEFYDKLLCVPILNLTVRVLDRWSAWLSSRLHIRSPIADWPPKRKNFAFMGVWILLFFVMVQTGFLTKGPDHPGGKTAFWEEACSEGRWKACKTWVRALNDTCGADTRIDCYKLGEVLNEGVIVPRDPEHAGLDLGRACDLGLPQGCRALAQFASADGKDVFTSSCDGGNGASCFILGSLYSGGAGVPKDPVRAFTLFGESCDRGWFRGCGRLGMSYLDGQGTTADPQKAIENFEKGCQGQNAASCVLAAEFYQHEYGPLSALAQERLKQACDLGLASACQTPALANAVSTPGD
jgi:hypothetical protein